MKSSSRKLAGLVVVAALLGLAALAPGLGPASGRIVLAANVPPGTTPPTIDGLLDNSYVYDGPTTSPDTPGKIYHYFDSGYCYYALVVDRGYNDNVFGDYSGATLDGWTQHRFKHLETSDGVLVRGAVADCEFNLDYLDRTGSPADWCSGTCGDAFYMDPVGCATVEAATSMWYNATQSTFGLANFDPEMADTDSWISPPLDYNCTSDDYYEWSYIYEFRIPVPAGGCGTLETVSAHNSPAKADQHGPGLARLGNFVWYDQNRNGLQDDGGGGMHGVCLHLYQAGPDGEMGTGDDVEVGMTSTNAEGEYWFDYLEAGTYYVDPGGVCIGDEYCHTVNEAEIPNDNGSMPDPAGDDPPVCGGGLESTVDPYPITLAVGEVYPFADFGYDITPTFVFMGPFRARPTRNGILLRWKTTHEIDNLGFDVYRAQAQEGERIQLNDGLILSVVPPGSGLGASYRYHDRTALRGTPYSYWLEAVDVYGNRQLFGPVQATLEVQAAGRLARPAP